MHQMFESFALSRDFARTMRLRLVSRTYSHSPLANFQLHRASLT